MLSFNPKSISFHLKHKQTEHYWFQHWFQDYIDQKLEAVNENIVRHRRYMRHRVSKVIWSTFLWKYCALQSFFCWNQYSIPLCYTTFLAFAVSSEQDVCWKHFIENRILNSKITLKTWNIRLIRQKMKCFFIDDQFRCKRNVWKHFVFSSNSNSVSRWI